MSLLTRTSTRDDKAPSDESTETPKQKKDGGRRRATPSSSSVNLLSPWVLDELHVRRLRRRFLAGAVALVVVAGAGWGMLKLDNSRGQDDLAADEAIGAGLQTQITDLADVKIYVNNVKLRSNSVEETMTRQVAFSTVMASLDRALPAGTALDSINVVLPPDPATAGAGASLTTDSLCPGPDPFGARPVIGCIELGGTADSRADISTIVQQLGRSDLFIEPYVSDTVTESTDGAGGIQFSISVGLDETTYTLRFADVDGSDVPDETADESGKKAKR